jgi:orotate phosphoribosyltransferase
MLTDTQIRQRLLETKALLEGHFLLRSGLHSNRFFQAAQLLQNTLAAAELCGDLAERCRHLGAETVISPAIGGIVVGQEVGRSLGVRAIFAEKDAESNLLLRRGFKIRAGEKFLVAEDVVTKGGRVQQTIDLVRAAGGVVVGVAVLVDRSGGLVDFGVPMFSLTKLDLPTFEPDQCPMCKAGGKPEKPGS